jgi:hypothetical protein
MHYHDEQGVQVTAAQLDTSLGTSFPAVATRLKLGPIGLAGLSDALAGIDASDR